MGNGWNVSRAPQNDGALSWQYAVFLNGPPLLVKEGEELFFSGIISDEDFAIELRSAQPIEQHEDQDWGVDDEILGYHFSMINDLNRAEMYNEALRRQVHPGNVVMDIGLCSENGLDARRLRQRPSVHDGKPCNWRPDTVGFARWCFSRLCF